MQRWLRRGYERVLRGVARAPTVVIVTVAILCAIAISRLPTLGGEFLPEFREGHFVLQVSAAPGTSLPEMLRIGKQISDALLKNPHVATIEQQVGRAEQGEDPWGPHRSEFHVDLKPMSGEEEEGVAGEIRAALANVPGIQFEVLTFLGDRIGESIAGENSAVVINLFGDDLDVLDAKAAEIAAALGNVSGAADVQVKSPPGAPRIAVRLRSERVAELGFRPLEVLDAVQAAYQGEVVAQVYRGAQVSDIAVILDEASRIDPERVGTLLLSSSQGLRVPLTELADVYRTSGRYSILHDGARRRQTVTCNPRGRDVQSFVAEARRIIESSVKLPAGVYLEFAGAAEAQRAATRELLLHASIAAVGIVLLLSLVLGRATRVLLVLANLPFALAGGVLALWLRKLTGEESALNMGALVGFVTLFGITTRNAIMLLSHYEHLVTKEGAAWTRDTAARGASERLVPILMTATVTALGLLPLALGSGEAGREIEGPMALVILGGLVTSTALNLLVLPTLAWQFGKFGEPIASHTPAP
jgi:Cu/Ag efflux pump CusA